MIKDETQLKVAFYIRVSTEEQAEKYGVLLQRSSLEGLIKSKGLLEDGSPAMILTGKEDQYVYIDDGISGQTEPRERPAFARLMEDIEHASEGQKPFDAVVVYKIDRFARRLKVLLEVVDFLGNNNVQFLSANESIDTSSPFGKAILHILGVIAELEIETIKQRTHEGRQQARDMGVFMGTTPPYGFQKNNEKKLEKLEDEAKIVRQIFSWFVFEGLNTQQIADKLQLLEIVSPEISAVEHNKRKGKIKKLNDRLFWRADTIRDILQDHIYIGEYWYDKTKTDKKTKKSVNIPRPEWKLSKYNYEPLIEPAIFNQAQHILGLYAKKIRINAAKSDTDHLYLLSGLLKCEHCAENGNMVSWTGTKKRISAQSLRYSYYYKCTRKNSKKYSHICTVLPIPAASLEEYMLNFIIKLLDNPEMVFKHQKELQSTQNQKRRLKKERNNYLKSLNSIPQRIENIRTQHTRGVIDTDKMLKEIEQQNKLKSQYEEEVKKLDIFLGEQEISEGYMNSFAEFSKRYKLSLDSLRKDRPQIINLFHNIIDEIKVLSRPVLELDSVAGRKKGDQFMPHNIEIKLRLPQEMLETLVKEFAVKPSTL